jgi:hypothetical protein
MPIDLLKIDCRVIDDMNSGFDYVQDEGYVDFGGACESVLELEDGSPDKAKALAQLAGYAIWYANMLRTEAR